MMNEPAEVVEAARQRVEVKRALRRACRRLTQDNEAANDVLTYGQLRALDAILRGPDIATAAAVLTDEQCDRIATAVAYHRMSGKYTSASMAEHIRAAARGADT